MAPTYSYSWELHPSCRKCVLPLLGPMVGGRCRGGDTSNNMDNSSVNKPPNPSPRPGELPTLSRSSTSTHPRLQDEIQSNVQSPPPVSGASEMSNKINSDNIFKGNNRNGRGRSRGGATRSRTMTKTKPHEIYRANQIILEELFTNKYYKKFYTIKSNSGRNLAEINVIRANKHMENILKGKPKKITELRDGSLLVEVLNEQQSNNIANITNLDGVQVEVTQHAKLNQVKGTIRYTNQPKYSPDDILSELKDTETYQTKRYIDGILMDSPIYILTFEACTIPQEISIGWTRCQVREYIPKPRRCSKCHTLKSCRSDEVVCVRCGGDSHAGHCER